MSVKKQFTKYVSQNVLGMIGMSLYILADTFFISLAVGANGITALNLVLPVYSLIFAIGSMIGVGSGIRFSVARSRNAEDKDSYFFNALFFGTVIGIFFMLIGGLIPDKIVGFLGGDATIIAVGAPYTRIFMMFAPCFIWNYICNAFVRNDKAPSVAMSATLFSSLFNIVMDYILMFPLGMGMEGAALATAFSPLIGVLICCTHLCSRKCGVVLKPVRPSVLRLIRSCQVGVSAFVGEISSGVTTAVFNTIILRIAGNIGVAAYGVVANTALVAVSMFNGVSLGAQPLLSEFYGKREEKKVTQTMRLGIGTALVFAIVIYLFVFLFTEPIAAVFNSEGNPVLAEYARTGLRLYFIGFLFAGVNIVGTGVLSAVESARWAFITSILRGFVAIILSAFIMSFFFGLNGVWLAFPVAEGITVLLMIVALRKETGVSVLWRSDKG